MKDKTLIIKSGVSNDAVRGYVFITMKQLGFKKDDIERVIDGLHNVFDMVTEDEAEKVYLDPFKYDKLKN